VDVPPRTPGEEMEVGVQEIVLTDKEYYLSEHSWALGTECIIALHYASDSEGVGTSVALPSDFSF
jgi:hypothetical protein